MKKSRSLTIVLIIGLLIRIIFTFFVAKSYFGRENIYVDADTWAWLNSFINLINNGSYSLNLAHEYGFFGRMPGYSFFLGFIYYLTGQNADVAFPIVAWIQIIADVFSIYLVAKISFKLFENNKISLFTSILYAFYPFIIVWNPVAYSESLSIFFMLVSITYLVGERKFKYFHTGVFVSLAILFRPQIALLVPAIGLYIIICNYKQGIIPLIKKLIYFGFAILLVYGSWPIRNYVNHNKIILTQDLRGIKNWDIDVLAFLQYVYSVKAEWEPQFSNIIQNKEVKFPMLAYENKEDSIKLERAIYLSKNCGSGFSNWCGYWKAPVEGENCNEEIKTIFDELRASQIKNNPLNFYLLLPLQNLKKALFKISLTDNSTMIRKLASGLFLYRTLLILLGFIGGIILMKRKKYSWLVFIAFPIILYLALCFGTSPQFRNIEMRYFLPADIMLLFPAAYFINFIYEKIKRRNLHTS